MEQIDTDFFNDCKKHKCFSLAPIAVEILLSWGSGQEIAAKSGTMLPENA